MKTFRDTLGYLLAGILVFFLLKPFLQAQTHLKTGRFEIQWDWLFCSFGAILFYWSAYLYPFAKLLSGFTGKQISFRNAFTLFHLANITRYLPGRIWGVVRLLSLSPRFGLSKTTVGSSLTLHVGIETVLGGLIATSLLFSEGMRETAMRIVEKMSAHTLLLTAVVMVCLAGVVCLIPKLAHPARAFLKTLLPLLKNAPLWVKVLVNHSLLWICQGLAFFLFVRSVAPVQWTEVAVLTACFAFAWIVGFLSFLTPGGLGIREGLLSLLLANYMPVPQASFVALLCRLWMLSAEIFLAGTAFLLHRNRLCSENA